MNYSLTVVIIGFIVLLEASIVLASGYMSEIGQHIGHFSNDMIPLSSPAKANSLNKTNMEIDATKIDLELMQILDKLADTDEIDVLIYSRGLMSEELERFLSQKQREQVLDYNILEIANCVVVRGQKQVIFEIANRNDVSRVRANPRFTTQ